MYPHKSIIALSIQLFHRISIRSRSLTSISLSLSLYFSPSRFTQSSSVHSNVRQFLLTLILSNKSLSNKSCTLLVIPPSPLPCTSNLYENPPRLWCPYIVSFFYSAWSSRLQINRLPSALRSKVCFFFSFRT